MGAALFGEAKVRVMVALAASALSGLASAALLGLINRALSAEDAALGVIAAQFLGASVAMFVLRWQAQIQFVHLGQGIQARLRQQLAKRFAHIDYAALERGGPGRMTAVLTDDVDAVAQLFVALPELALQSAVILGCLGYLAWLSPLAFVATLVFLASGAGFYHLSNLQGLAHLRSAREAEDGLFRHFHALFDGSKELRLNARLRRTFLERSVGGQTDRIRGKRTRALLVYARANSWGSFLLFALIGSVLFLLPLVTPIESHVMSAYALTFLYLILPLEGFLGALPAVATARVAFDRIEAVSAEPCVEQEDGMAEATPFRSLALCAVEHAYRREGDDVEFVLGPLDLSLSPGEVVFVTGGNGSGKTTLAKVLVGLYAPARGEIRLNDRPIDDAERPQYRQMFSAVFTDFCLFDVGLSAAETSADVDSRAAELLSELRIAHKLRVKDGVFSTTALSRGQRKRLALLVTVLEDRPVLVFDEWAADQDPSFKDFFYRKLLPDLKARGKAVLVITHDDRYFELADRHLVLSEGRLIKASLLPDVNGLMSAREGRPDAGAAN